MSTCRDIEVLLSLRAADALDPDEVATVESHLAGCPACRAEAEAEAEALALVKLSPPDEAELRALRDLPGRTLEALRRAERRRFVGRRLLAGVAVMAAAGLALLAPAVLRHAPEPPPAEAAAAPKASWEIPDPDRLWEDAGIIEDDTSALAGGDGTDAVIAALDQ